MTVTIEAATRRLMSEWDCEPYSTNDQGGEACVLHGEVWDRSECSYARAIAVVALGSGEDHEERCGDTYDPYGFGQRLRCGQPEGHDGTHRDQSLSIQWENEDSTPKGDGR